MSKSPAERMKRMIRKKKRRSVRLNANGREAKKIHYFRHTHTNPDCVCFRWVHGFESEALPSSFCCHFSFCSINPSFSSWANGPCLTIAHWGRVTLCHVLFLAHPVFSSESTAMLKDKSIPNTTTQIHTHAHILLHTHSDVNFVQSIYHLICSPANEMCVSQSRRLEEAEPADKRKGRTSD